eukprot:4383809-Prymnesium_polylepis.1
MHRLATATVAAAAASAAARGGASCALVPARPPLAVRLPTRTHARVERRGARPHRQPLPRGDKPSCEARPGWRRAQTAPA